MQCNLVPPKTIGRPKKRIRVAICYAELCLASGKETVILTQLINCLASITFSASTNNNRVGVGRGGGCPQPVKCDGVKSQSREIPRWRQLTCTTRDQCRVLCLTLRTMLGHDLHWCKAYAHDACLYLCWGCILNNLVLTAKLEQDSWLFFIWIKNEQFNMKILCINYNVKTIYIRFDLIIYKLLKLSVSFVFERQR